MSRCDELATFTEEPGRITRSYGTPALTEARELVAQWMRDAGLDVQIDAVGNVRGRVEGSEPTAPALLLGSHLDSVRDAGRYDGPLGILVAIETVDQLRERTTARSLPGRSHRFRRRRRTPLPDHVFGKLGAGWVVRRGIPRPRR